MHLSITYFCMLKDSLKLMIKFPPPKWVGYFTIFLQKLALQPAKNNFHTNCEKFETFPTVFKLGLERCACNVSKVFPKNCWISRDPKNADHNSRIEGEKNI